MVSFFGIAVAFGVSVVAAGKELPNIARSVGFGVGRSVSWFRHLRAALREAARDPEVERMTRELEQGLEDVRRIRAEINAISSARSAVPYVMSKLDAPVSTQTPTAANITLSASPPAEATTTTPTPVSSPVSSSPQVLVRLPEVSSRIYSPAYTDSLPGGADILIECIQQKELLKAKQ